MKLGVKLAVILLLGIFALSFTAVQAAWSSLNSGFAVTTNYHGVDVPLGTEVTARAGTTEYPEVTEVRFRWMPPIGDEILTDKIPLQNSGEYFDGKLVYDAYNTTTINVLGDWGVQVWFYSADGKLRNQTGIEKIRATSFFAVAEVPLGTIAIILSMLGGLGVFVILKSKKAPRVR